MPGLSQAGFKFLKNPAVIKFLATLGEDGYPNLVPVLSTIAWDLDTLCFVRFMIWKTRRNLEERNKVAVGGFGLLKSLEVSGEFVGFEKSGARLEYFNNQSLYRYNAYFGAGQVGVIKVIEQKEWIKTGLWRAVHARLISVSDHNPDNEPEVMPPVVQEKFQRWLSVKYVSWIDGSGKPRLAPVPGAFPISKSRISILGDEQIFKKLTPETKLSLSVLSTEPNAYQVKGRFLGMRTTGAGTCYYLVELEKSYSAGPPLAGEQIYPPEPWDGSLSLPLP